LAAEFEQAGLHNRRAAVVAVSKLIGFLFGLLEFPMFGGFLRIGPTADKGFIKRKVLLSVKGANGSDETAGENQGDRGQWQDELFHKIFGLLRYCCFRQ